MTLFARSSHGSRFKGWDGTVKGSAKRLVVPAPLNGLPTDVEATFDKAARPTVKIRAQFNPKEIKLRLGCGEPVTCKLRVAVSASWLPKNPAGKAHQASLGRENSIECLVRAGSAHKDVTVSLGKEGRQMDSYLKKHPGRKGTITVVVKDTETGLGMAINEKGLPGDKKPNKPPPKK